MNIKENMSSYGENQSSGNEKEKGMEKIDVIWIPKPSGLDESTNLIESQPHSRSFTPRSWFPWGPRTLLYFHLITH